MPQVARVSDPISCGDHIATGSPSVFANNIPVARKGDSTTGHDSSPPTTIATGSPSVFANNIPVARVNDTIVPHSHSGFISAGSPNVWANESSAIPTMTAPIASVYIFTNAEDKQISSDPYTASVHDTDDEEAPDENNQLVPLSSKSTYVRAAAYQQAVDIDTPQTIIETAAISPSTSVETREYTYNDIIETHQFTNQFRLSPNFTLGMLTTQCRVSNYVLQDQFTNGQQYSSQQIVKNLRDLCFNILEPLKQMYPAMIINSGFRKASNGKSQHERGQAADVGLIITDTDVNQAWTIAQTIANSNLPYDQFIFEQNNTIWFHISYDRNKNTQRRMVLTKPKNRQAPYIGLYKLS